MADAMLMCNVSSEAKNTSMSAVIGIKSTEVTFPAKLLLGPEWQA
jgi:hypothetical protein